MRFIPMPGVVLVEPIKDDSVMQTTGRDYTNAAKIVYIREKDFLREMGWKEGDIVFYDEYAYRRFEHEGKEIFAVDTRGDGIWFIGKTQDDEHITPEPLQKERLPTSVQTGTANGQWNLGEVPPVQ